MERAPVDCYRFAIYFLFQECETDLQGRFRQVWLFSTLLSLELHTLRQLMDETERHSFIVNLCLPLFCSPKQGSYVRCYRSAGQVWIWNPAKRVFVEVVNKVASERWSTDPVSRRNSQICLFQKKKKVYFEEGNTWMKKCRARKADTSSHWLLLLLLSSL